MAQAEWPEKWAHRRCHACKGPKWLQRYELVPDVEISVRHPQALVDFHETCIGAWLMQNVGVAVQFYPGVVE